MALVMLLAKRQSIVCEFEYHVYNIDHMSTHVTIPLAITLIEDIRSHVTIVFPKRNYGI